MPSSRLWSGGCRSTIHFLGNPYFLKPCTILRDPEQEANPQLSREPLQTVFMHRWCAEFLQGCHGNPVLFFFIQEKISLLINKAPFHSTPWLLFRGLTALRGNRWAGPEIKCLRSSLLTNALYSSALSTAAFSLSTSCLGFLAENCPFYTAWRHTISDSGFSALLFYSQEIQFSVLMFSCPFPLICEFLVIFFKILFCCA